MLESIGPKGNHTMNSQAKKVAQCARKVKEIGVDVQELLRQEDSDKDARATMLKMLNLALDDEETTLSRVTTILDEANASLKRLTKQRALAIARENKLIAAVEKKKNDVDRSYKLLESLNIGGSTHNAEYDRLQEELQVEYDRYVVKIRNVDYLENELRSYHSFRLHQRERAERKARCTRDAYREGESLQMLEGEGGEAEQVNHDDNSDENANEEPSRSDESLSAPSCDDISGSVYDSDGSESSDSNF